MQNVTLKNFDSLLLQYHNDHDFTYKSPVASSILHEVGTRIAVSQATKKKRVQLQIAESMARRRTRKVRNFYPTLDDIISRFERRHSHFCF